MIKSYSTCCPADTMVCQVERRGFLLEHMLHLTESICRKQYPSLPRPYTSTDWTLFEDLRYSEEERTSISMATELPRISTFHGSINRTLNKKSNSTSTVIFAIRFLQKTYLSSLTDRLSPHTPGRVQWSQTQGSKHSLLEPLGV